MKSSQLLVESKKYISLRAETRLYKEAPINLGSPDEVFTPLYWKYICEETNAIEVPTSVLDKIWTEIRQTPSIVRRCLIENNG